MSLPRHLRALGPRSELVALKWMGAGGVLAAWMAGLGACGGGESQAPTHHRLHARYEVAGSARRQVGWHDEELDVDCTFDAFIENLEHRCLPPVTATETSYYADPACTETVVPSFDIPMGGYLMDASVDSCLAGPRIYEVGETLDANHAYWVMNGVCGLIGGSAGPFVRRGKEVPKTRFAVAREEHTVPGQLSLVTEDGARQAWGGWDGQRAVTLTKTSDHRLRWGPASFAYSGFGDFADDACSVGAAVKDMESARCPVDAAQVYENDACGYSVSFAALGAPIATSYSKSDSGTCEAEPQAGLPAYFWAMGDLIPNADLLELGFTNEGEGAVKVRRATLLGQSVERYANGGNNPPSVDPFVDGESGLICEPQPAADGRTRCLPPPTSTTTFADAACSEPLFSFTDPCSKAPPPSLVGFSDAAGRVHVSPLGDVVPDGSHVYYLIDSHCEGGTGIDTYYRVGAELPATRFAEVTIEVEK